MPSLLKSGGLKFGGQDYIQVPYTTLHAPISAITVESWAYSPNWQSNVGQRILSKTEGGGYNLALNDTGVGLSFTLLLNGSYYSALLSSTSISTGWHHIIGTCDGRYVNLYIDGVLVKSTDTGAYKNIGYTNNNNLCIGTEAGNTVATNSQNFVGTIGATRIYNRALSPTEVYNNYQGNVTRSGLVGEWLLNANSGTVAKDTSGNGNDGTLNGGQWVSRATKQKPKKNLFNQSTVTTGQYIYWVNGTLQPSGLGNTASDYIRVIPSTTYVGTNTNNAGNTGTAFYDVGKNFISGTQSNPFTTPTNAAYTRITVLNTDLNTAQIEQGSTATVFEPYTLVPDLVNVVTQRPVTAPKKAVKYSSQVDYQFSRASIEPYNGLYFPNDTPRVDSNGVIVEEGTSNLVPIALQSIETDSVLSSFSLNNTGTTASRDTTTYVIGTSSLKVMCDGTVSGQGADLPITLLANTIYTASVWLKGTGTVQLRLSGSAITNTITTVNLTNVWTRYTVTGTSNGIGGSAYIMVTTAGGTSAPLTYWADGYQLEQKAYATSFTDNPLGRQAETLTFPANVLNASAGTIESWVLPAPKATGTSEVWWTVLHSDGWGWVGINSNGISVGSSDLSATTIVDRTKPIHIVQTWNGSVIKVYANGVLLGSGSGTITLLPTIYLGVWYNGVSYRGNMAIKSLRISNIARTDADIANSYNQSLANMHLPFDDSTTKLLNF